MITPDRPILVWTGCRFNILIHCLSSHQIIGQLVSYRSKSSNEKEISHGGRWRDLFSLHPSTLPHSEPAARFIDWLDADVALARGAVENKLSRGERERAWLELTGFSHLKVGSYDGLPSAGAPR